MFTVYGDLESGNCYKIKLLLSFLEIGHKWKHIDILKGESHSPEFLALNPNGKIPVLVLEDGRCLSESNAIINYLAEGSQYFPGDPWMRAQILQWQFFEQYSHEPYIAVARYINKYLGMPAAREAEYHAKQAGGHKALKLMDDHLSLRSFFVGDQLSNADISLFAYTHVAGEGGFDLAKYPSIEQWIRRVKSSENYFSMRPNEESAGSPS